MAFWNRAEKRAALAKSPNQAFVTGLGMETSPTGKNVTPQTSISGTVAVYAAVGIIADAISTLPLKAFARSEDGREELPDSHPLQRLLRRPNEELTGQEFWEAIAAHNLLWGNAYALIDRDGSGRPVQMWPLRPDRVTAVLMDREANIIESPDPRRTLGLHRVYVYELPSGEKVGIDRDQVLHVRALATDGLNGLSPISVARTQVALEQAASEYGARFFANGATLGTVLSFPAGTRELKSDDKKRIRKEWQRTHGGVSNAHKLAILEGGVEVKTIGMPMEDAQFIETRRFQIGEIARLYRIPPHLVGDTDRSTSWGTGIEQQTIGFITYTLRPWLERIEQAIDRDLGSGRSGLSLHDLGQFAEFSVEGLLRGDSQTRAQFYEVMTRIRAMVPNEVRRKENMPPLPGGDEPHVPVNMGPPNEAPGGTVVIDDGVITDEPSV